MGTEDKPQHQSESELLPDGILSVHFGRAANCSSIGSFVDFLFVSTALGGAALSVVAALLRERESQDEAPPPASEPSPSGENGNDGRQGG